MFTGRATVRLGGQNLPTLTSKPLNLLHDKGLGSQGMAVPTGALLPSRHCALRLQGGSPASPGRWGGVEGSASAEVFAG